MRPITAGLVWAAALAGAAGCSGAGSLPEGVAVSVYQTRSDVPARKLEIQVANGSGAPITITRAAFASPLFDGDAVRQRETQVPAGQVIDLKVALPPASCTPGARPQPEVTLEYRGADGEPSAATVVPTDPLEQLPELTAQECLQRAVVGIVTITPESRLGLPDPRGTSDRGGISDGQQPARGVREGDPAVLRFAVEPTGAPGTVTIQRAHSTILLALVDAEADLVDRTPLDVTIGPGSAAQRIELPFVPARCDLHALADDKRGTLVPFDVSLDSGDAGRITVALPEGLRSRVFAHIVRECDRR